MYMTGGHMDSCRVVQPFTLVVGTKTLLFPQYWSVICVIHSTSNSPAFFVVSLLMVLF